MRPDQPTVEQDLLTAPASGASDVSRLASGAAAMLAGRATGRGLAYIAQLFIGRVLGPAGYGLYAIGLNLALLIALLASLGLEHGVIRWGSRRRGWSTPWLTAVAGKALMLTVVCGAAAALLLVGLTPWIAGTVYRKPGLEPVLAVFALAVVFRPLLRVAAAGTRATQRMRQSILSEELGQPALQLALIAAFFALGWQLMGAVAATVLSTGLAAVLALVLLWRALPQPGEAQPVSPVSVRQLVAFSVPAALAGLLGSIAMWTDRLLVGYFRSAAETGVYQAASQAAVLFVIILSSFNAIFAPMIADLLGRGASERLQSLYRISTKWGLYLGVPVFLVFATAPRQVLTVLYDPRFADGAQAMLLLAAAQMVNLASGAVGFLLLMSGRQGRWVLLSAAALALNVGLNLLWIPRFGLEGAAAATALSISGLFLFALFEVRRSMGLWPFDRRYLKGLVAAAAAALALVGVRALGLADPRLEVGLLAVTACIVFCGVLLLLGLDAEDRDVLARVAGRAG